MTNAPNHAHLIGVIILTKCLGLPLTRYEAMIEKMEGSPMFTQLWPDIISTPLFPGTRVLEPARDMPSNVIGQLRKDKEGFSVYYRHSKLAQEYLLDEEKMKRWEQSHTLSDSDKAGIQALRRQLRLVNTRNRLTHMILMGIVEHQGPHLISGKALHLRPLSQVDLAEWIKGEMREGSRFLPPGSELEFIDNSIVSRLTRNISVLNHQGRAVPLRDLFSSTRDMHKRMIEAILDDEKKQIQRGNIDRAYTDEEIKQKLEERYSVSISRRAVSACRQDMRIPSSYTRNNNHTYPPEMVNFSFYYPLNVTSVKSNAPQVPGVYEISLADMEVGYPLGFSGVVYVGSTGNLEKRLRDYLRPSSKNRDLKALLNNHRAVFRYIVKRKDVRAEEKLLGQCFILAYGALPCCNHIKP